MRVDFHPLAIRELLESAVWYKKRSPQAAEWFSEEIDHAIKKIKLTPNQFVRVVRVIKHALWSDFLIKLSTA